MRELLRERGLKMTAQRELIFRLFLNSARHISVDELFVEVQKQDPSIGYSTVWRNLKLICRIGLAEEVNLGDGVTRYDRVTTQPHGHLYCLKCGRYVEFDVEAVVKPLARTAAANRFQAEEYRIEIQGYCRKCRAAKSQRSGERSTRTRTPKRKSPTAHR